MTTEELIEAFFKEATKNKGVPNDSEVIGYSCDGEILMVTFSYDFADRKIVDEKALSFIHYLTFLFNYKEK